MKKAVLGRGLSALIPMEQSLVSPSQEIQEEIQTQLVSQLVREAGKESSSDTESFQYLNVNDITPNPFQPRIRFDEGKLKELSETIRQNGLIQPIVVRKTAGRFEIVSGERRWQATKLAQM